MKRPITAAQMSHPARIVHSVIQYAIMSSPHASELTISDLENLLRPIFGQQPLDEVREFWTPKPHSEPNNPVD